MKWKLLLQPVELLGKMLPLDKTLKNSRKTKKKRRLKKFDHDIRKERETDKVLNHYGTAIFVRHNICSFENHQLRR